jgi:translation initiation factor IF-2
LGEGIAFLVTKQVEVKPTAQSRIRDLEIKLAIANVISESLVKDHSAILEELASVKTEANLQPKAHIARLSETTDEAVAQYNRAKVLVKSTFGLRIKFH